MTKPIDLVLKEINKENGENTIGRVDSFTNLAIERLPSGSFFLDWALGGGFPRGKIIELYGQPSSGKSLISAITVAQTQKKKGECIWIDAESAFDPDFAELLGVDVKRLIISQSAVGEPTMEMIYKIITESEPDLIVVDSVAAMIPQAELDTSLEQAVMGTRARMMSRGLAKLNALNSVSKKRTTIVFINQLRTDIGSYGSPQVTPGGSALKFYASIRVDIKRGDFLEEGKQKIGQVVKFRVTKNKTAPPFREGYFKFLYDGSIDRADELVTIGMMNGKVKQGGAWFECAGQRFQGRDTLETEIRNNEEYRKAVEKEIV